MRQVLFFWPGSFRPADGSKLNFNKLAVTGRNSGTISYQDVEMALRSGNSMGVRRVTTHEPYIIAAHVTGNDYAGCGVVFDRQEKDGKDAKAATLGKMARR